MNYLISVSHSDFDRFRSNMEKVVEICSISGFSGIEGHHRLFYGLDRKHLEKAGEIFSDSRIKIPTFHLPCSQDPDLDLVNPDREYREKAVVIYREWIEKAALLGAGKAVIHGTTLFSGSPETDIEVLVDRFAESFEPVLESAVKNRIVLALENHNPSVKGRFCSETDHFKRILERFDSPSLMFCFDFGHAYIGYGNMYDELFDFMEKKITAVHLHDNTGGDDIHLPPGYGDLDWKKVRRLLKRINIPYLCIEAAPHPSIERFIPADWKKLLNETAELLN